MSNKDVKVDEKNDVAKEQVYLMLMEDFSLT